MNRYELVVVAEEGNRSGGFGEYVAELSRRRNCSASLVILGVGEKFDALGKREELLQRNGLDAGGIAEAVLKQHECIKLKNP